LFIFFIIYDVFSLVLTDYKTNVSRTAAAWSYDPLWKQNFQIRFDSMWHDPTGYDILHLKLFSHFCDFIQNTLYFKWMLQRQDTIGSEYTLFIHLYCLLLSISTYLSQSLVSQLFNRFI